MTPEDPSAKTPIDLVLWKMAATTLLKRWIQPFSHVGIIEFTNPSNRNALSMATLEQLHESIQSFNTNPSVRVVLLQAQGPVFSSGHDLKEIQSLQRQKQKQELGKLFHLCSETMVAIQKSPKPFIAKVDGVATAAGCQLVASCDLAYASTRCKFALPGVNLGLFCSTPAVAVGRNVPRKMVMEMLLTGQFVDSEKAQQIGLVNQIFHHDQLDQQVDEILDVIASKSSHAILTGKPVFCEQMNQPTLEMAYSIASKHMTDSSLSNDCVEGVDAFLNKREPKW